MGIKSLLGKKIKEIRLQKGLTQEELSEQVNISQRALSGIETGMNFLTAETLDKIVSVLNVGYDELFFVEHLKSTDDLVLELIDKINRLKNNPEKLQEVYKVVNAMLNV